MMWQTVIAALGLVFVFEGILPFLSPNMWRRIIQQMFIQNNRTLHMMGLTSMLLGLALVYIAHNFY